MRRGQLVDLWAKCQRRVIDGVTDYDQRQKKDYMEIFKKKTPTYHMSYKTASGNDEIT